MGAVVPTLEEKQIYFDEYWRSQPDSETDPRALQRAHLAYRLLSGKAGRLLDLGCGRGVALDYFESLGYEVTGADVSREIITMISRNGIRAQILDIERDEPYEKYDIILCLEVLQQLYYPVRALKRLKDALEDDGEMIVAVPNEFNIFARLKILLGLSMPGNYDHSHIRLFTPRRDKELFEKVNLEIAGRIYVPPISPGWKFLTRLLMPLTRIFPSLLAASSIYKLRKL